MNPMLKRMAECGDLGGLLRFLAESDIPFRTLDHWVQGDFHHDLVLRFENPDDLPARVLVVSTNCNGAIKEIVCFDEVPDRWGLWHHRCPENVEFLGELPPIRGEVRTESWFDPCVLLKEGARSEFRPEHQTRQRGGSQTGPEKR